jgi:ABC-type branched-subunit amino acid transport system substrate-binding protein
MHSLIKKININKINFKGLQKLPKITMKKLIILIIIIILIFLLVYFTLKFLRFGIYEQIDHDKKFIYFGETCDLENNQTSIDYSLGYQLAFEFINRNGGINGYIIKIILLNDKYETDLAIKNAKMLIDYYNVLSLIGTFGTPTSVGIINEAIKDRHIPLIGPFSAGTSYRQYFNKYLIIMNGTFYPEFELSTQNMIKNSYKNISIIYQNDIYGNFFYNSFIDYSLKNNLPFNIVSSGSYERNSDDLDNTFTSIFGVKNAYNYNEYTSNKINSIQAVIIFAAEKQISSIIGQLKKMKPSIGIYYNFFVGTRKTNLEYLKYSNKDNIYQTLLSHSNLDDYPELNKIFMNEIKIYNDNNVKKINELNSSLIQGFYSGIMIGKVLENFKDMKKINRETFTNMFYEMKTIDVYGFPIGPFIMDKNNEGIRYAEINKLQSNLEFKTIKTNFTGDYKSH